MTHIWRVWCHTKNACDIVYMVGVRTQIVAWCLMCSVYVALYTGCAFIYRGCDVVSTVDWWHNDWMIQGFNLIPPIPECCAKSYKEDGTSVIVPHDKEVEENHLHRNQGPPTVIRSAGRTCVCLWQCLCEFPGYRLVDGSEADCPGAEE